MTSFYLRNGVRSSRLVVCQKVAAATIRAGQMWGEDIA